MPQVFLANYIYIHYRVCARRITRSPVISISWKTAEALGLYRTSPQAALLPSGTQLMWFLSSCSSTLLLLVRSWSWLALGSVHLPSTPVLLTHRLLGQRLLTNHVPPPSFPYWTQLWLDIGSPLLLPKFSRSYLLWLISDGFPYFCPLFIFLPLCPYLSYLLFITFTFPKSFHGQSCQGECLALPCVTQ